MFFNLDKKKILYALAFILLVFIFGFLIYQTFFAPLSEPKTTDQPEQTATTTKSGTLPLASSGTTGIPSGSQTGGLPGQSAASSSLSATAKGGLTKTSPLVNTPALDPVLSASGQDIQYYNRTEGKFYRIDNSGTAVSMTDKVFYNVSKVHWAPDKNKAILDYPDGSNILFDFSTNKQHTLPKHWKDFDFSPDSSRIVMKSIGLDPNNRWLAIADSDGSKAQTIEDLGDMDKEVIPSWSPNNQTVAMVARGIDFDRQEIYFAGMNKENFKTTVVEGRNVQPKWSPKGDRLLYSASPSTNGYRPDLWIVNAQGDGIGANRKKLNVQTWANKCVFSDNITLYCAVPRNINEGEGLLPEETISSTDDLYKINTQTGTKTLLAIPDGNFNISNLVVSSNQSNLYFRDRITENIYNIGLK